MEGIEQESVRKHPGGFTLIELVVAILIFAIGIVGISKMQTLAIQANAYSMQLSEANNVARDTIEKLMSLPLTSSTFGGEETLTATSTFSWPGLIQGNILFSRSWSASQIAGTDARQIDVLVTWSEKDTPHSISFSFVKGL